MANASDPPIDTDSEEAAEAVARAAEGSGTDHLIAVLQALQAQRGHLDGPTLALVAERLDLSPSRVFGVVSFYHLFRRAPRRPHRCQLCLGTACAVQGGWEIRQQLEPNLSDDWDLALESCLGVCGQAPLLLLDGVLVGRLPAGDPAALKAVLEGHGLALRRAGAPLRRGGLSR